MNPYREKILLFTLVRTLVNTMHRMVYALLPAFARGVGVDLETFARALAVRSLLGVASPLIGSVSDQRGRKFGILLGMSLFLLGTGIVIVWPTFHGLVTAMLLTTMGKYVLDPSMHAFVGDQVPYHQRGLAIALIEMGWSLSFIVGIPLAGFLIARGGWMAPFPLLAGLALLSIIILAWQLPNVPAQLIQRTNLFAGVRDILTHPSAIAGLLVGLWMSAANEVVNIIFGVWLEESFQLQVTALGAASLVIGISELAGEGLVGAITDRVGKTRAIAGGLILNSLMALALPVLGRALPGAVVGLFLFYITFEFSLVSSIPMMTEIMPGRRATLLAVNIAGLSLGRALAAWIAPSVFALGIFASGLVAVGFNLFSLLALRGVQVEDSVRLAEKIAS
ncbi:MAG TPA: MFS transporter [Anaerolineales bacterium]|nr:MFS transporter [Anaerolineales bacterium]